MKKIGFILIIVMLLVGTTACGTTAQQPEASGEGQGNDGNQTAQLEKIDIMLDWFPNAVHTYLYTAIEQGYFEDEGLEVTIRTPANPTDPINLAAAGQVTLGITYQPDVIMARANGVPVVSVAAIVRSPLNHIIMLNDSPIQTPGDLVGKRVGYPGIPVNEPLLKTMVEADGGDFSQVQMIDVGFNLGSSLVSQSVDAVIGAYINHEVPVLQHEGHQVRYFDPIDYGVPSFYELVIVTNDRTLTERREAIEAFWRAAQKGYNYMKENKVESLDLLFSKQDEANFPLIREVEEQSLDILLTKMEAVNESFGSQSKESWNLTIQWLLESGLISEAPELDDIFINIVN